MNKSIVVCLALVGFLTVSAGRVMACHEHKGGEHFHSFMVLEHAKELGLSKKQKSQLEKIQQNLKHDMKDLGKKYGDETEAVLTKEQNKKWDSLKAKAREDRKKGDKKEGAYCPMKNN